jgi:hypothetical protein
MKSGSISTLYTTHGPCRLEIGCYERSQLKQMKSSSIRMDLGQQSYFFGDSKRSVNHWTKWIEKQSKYVKELNYISLLCGYEEFCLLAFDRI